MKNVNLIRISFHDGKDVANFDVYDAQKQTDGTITADLCCTHGNWRAKAVFNENGSVDLSCGDDHELVYHSYEVVS